MDNLNERIEIAKKTFKPANCIGTMAFLAGLKDKDSIIESFFFYKDIFPQLQEIEKTIPHSIVTWEEHNKEPYDKMDFMWFPINGEKRIIRHAGILLSPDLPFVVHRPGAYAEWDDSNAKLRYDSYFDIIQKTYGGKRELIDIHFYKIK